MVAKNQNKTTKYLAVTPIITIFAEQVESKELIAEGDYLKQRT